MNVFNRPAKIFEVFQEQESHWARYRIIDFASDTGDKERYRLQHVHDAEVVEIELKELMCNAEILYALPSAQACYLGVQCGKRQFYSMQCEYFLMSRYGAFDIFSCDREGNICFAHKFSGRNFMMAPEKIIADVNQHPKGATDLHLMEPLKQPKKYIKRL